MSLTPEHKTLTQNWGLGFSDLRVWGFRISTGFERHMRIRFIIRPVEESCDDAAIIFRIQNLAQRYLLLPKP